MDSYVLTFFWDEPRPQPGRMRVGEVRGAGQRIGHVRVSMPDQNEKRQLEGQVLDKIFTDKASGRDTARRQLAKLLRLAREGDTLWLCTAWTGLLATSMAYVPSSMA